MFGEGGRLGQVGVEDVGGDTGECHGGEVWEFARGGGGVGGRSGC